MVQLMPLGGVSIDQATLKYGLVMRAARQSTDVSRLNPGTAASHSPRLLGRLGQTVGGTDGPALTTDANLTIEMTFRQIDLPQGILDLLQRTQGGVEATVGGDSEAKETAAEILFTVDLLKKSSAIVTRGIEFTLDLRIEGGSDDEPIEIEFTASPTGAFAVRSPRGVQRIVGARDLSVTILVEKRARLPSSRGTWGLLIAGTTARPHAAEQRSHSVLISLPTIR